MRETGIAKRYLTDESTDITPFLDTILEKVAPATAKVSSPLRLQSFNLAYDDFLGRLGVGRVYEGDVKSGQILFLKKLGGQLRQGV